MSEVNKGKFLISDNSSTENCYSMCF